MITAFDSYVKVILILLPHDARYAVVTGGSAERIDGRLVRQPSKIGVAGPSRQAAHRLPVPAAAQVPESGNHHRDVGGDQPGRRSVRRRVGDGAAVADTPAAAVARPQRWPYVARAAPGVRRDTDIAADGVST